MSVRFEYLTSTELSDIGRKRSRNEDAVTRIPEYGVFCLADGMGGGDAGDEASQRTVEGVADGLRTHLAGRTAATGDTKCRVVRREVNLASQWIHQRSQERGRGVSGSTVVTLVFDPVKPSAAFVLHAGDSRLYRFRKNALAQITSDHSFAAEAGYKSGDQIPQQFRGVVTRAVGIKDSVELERTELDIVEGDLLLMCSDGLSGMVPDKKIRKFCRKHAEKPLEELAQALVAAANEAGGKDNISVVLVRAGALVPIPASEAFDLPEEEREEEREDEPTTEETLPSPVALADEEDMAGTEEDAIPAGERAVPVEPASGQETVSSASPPGEPASPRATPPAEPAMPAAPAEPAGVKAPAGSSRFRVPVIAAVLLVALCVGGFLYWKQHYASPSAAPAGPQEWIAAMQAGREDGETYLAYAGRLKDYVVRLGELAEQYPDSSAVGEATEAVRARARAVPQSFEEEFARQIGRGSRKAAERLFEDWQQMKQYCGLLGIDDARHASVAAGLQSRMAGLDRLDAVREVSEDVQFETAYLQQLAGHLEELKAVGDEKDEGVRQAVMGIQQAAFEWSKQFDRSFAQTVQDRNMAGLERALLKWESVGGLPGVLALVKDRYTEQRGEIDRQLRVWAASLTDEVNAGINRRAVEDADAALRKLRGLAHALRKTSFAASVSQTSAAAAKTMERAREAQATAGNETARLREMIERLDGIDITALAEALAAFGSLRGLQGVDPAVVDELRAGARAKLVGVSKSAAERAAGAFKAFEIEKGDGILDELTRFVGRVPDELGRERLDPLLEAARKARRETEQSVGDLTKQLTDAASTLADAAADGRWQAAVVTLHGLAPRRTLNAAVKGAWGTASAALEKRLQELLSDTSDYGRWRKQVDQAGALLGMAEMETVLAVPIAGKLKERLAAEREALEAVAGLLQLGGQVQGGDVAGVSGILRTLAASHAKWSPPLRDRLAPRADSLVAACAGRTAALIAQGADIAALRSLVNQAEFLRFVPKEKCGELVAAINKRDQRSFFQKALQTGEWGAFWRNVGSAPDDARPLAELGIESAAREWHALWAAALADIMTRQRRQRLEKHRDTSREIYDAAGLDEFSMRAPDWTCAREQWADYFCRYVYEDGVHLSAGLARKVDKLMTVVDSLEKAPANAPDEMWKIVGLNRNKDAARLAARLDVIRGDLALLKEWTGELRESPLSYVRAKECPAEDIPILKRIGLK
jgi:PPM family protein phosphatase